MNRRKKWMISIWSVLDCKEIYQLWFAKQKLSIQFVQDKLMPPCMCNTRSPRNFSISAAQSCEKIEQIQCPSHCQGFIANQPNERNEYRHRLKLFIFFFVHDIKKLQEKWTIVAVEWIDAAEHAPNFEVLVNLRVVHITLTTARWFGCVAGFITLTRSQIDSLICSRCPDGTSVIRASACLDGVTLDFVDSLVLDSCS